MKMPIYTALSPQFALERRSSASPPHINQTNRFRQIHGRFGWGVLACVRLIGLVCLAQIASADTVSWWRFEQDDDPSLSGFENPNEMAGEPALISSNAVLGTSSPDLFAPVVPGPGVPNTASVRSRTQGGTEGIFGTAAYSSTLDVESSTVEFWVRTTESDAGFVARTSDPTNNAGEQNQIVDGLRIVDPNSVRVDFWTSTLRNNGRYRTGTGRNGLLLTTIDSGISINDGDWHYIAFSFDSATGRSRLVVDFAETEVDLRDNRVIYWGGNRPGAQQSEVTMGYRLDGNSGNNTGTLDEVRFTDAFEDDSDLLSPIPEPGTVATGDLIVLFAAASEWRRRSEQVSEER